MNAGLIEQILAKLDGRIVFESHTDILTYHCVHCGWWRVENRSSANPSVDYIFPTLKKFNVGSRDLPLGILWTEILKKPDLLLLINCTVFERFVAEVLSSELGIKVKHIGRTGDGGIDLFYCHGDQNCAIQVKRRTKNDSVEGVSLVREFLGAMLLGGYNNGKIVTTANRFTDGAYRAKSVAEEKGLVSSIDLVDKNEFLINFKYDPSRASCPWEYVFYDVATKTDWGPNYQVIINKSTILKNRI